MPNKTEIAQVPSDHGEDGLPQVTLENGGYHIILKGYKAPPHARA